MIAKIPSPEYPEAKVIKATDKQRADALRAAQALEISFNWSKSAEGYDFWDGVSNRLRQIANNGVINE